MALDIDRRASKSGKDCKGMSRVSQAKCEHKQNTGTRLEATPLTSSRIKESPAPGNTTKQVIPGREAETNQGRTFDAQLEVVHLLCSKQDVR